MTPKLLIAGRLAREYIILSTKQTLQDVPGGNVLYAAAGLTIWEHEQPPGLLARVGEDYPQEWLEEMKRYGYDTRGIRVLPEAVDLRSFSFFTDRITRKSDDPVVHFARMEISFPKALLGWRPQPPQPDSRTRPNVCSLRQSDVPIDYREAQGAHICPIDFISHTLLPAVFRQAGINTVTMDPSAGYMNPVFWNDIPSLLTGLTAFMPSEEEIRALFHGRSSDLWEMAEALTKYGCEFIVIKRGAAGVYLYDSVSRARWEIPAYPCRLDHAAGAGDAFCGGFLAGYRQSYDPFMAALHGSISASLVIEGQGPYYALHALPGLAQARLEALKDSARRV